MIGRKVAPTLCSEKPPSLRRAAFDWLGAEKVRHAERARIVDADAGRWAPVQGEPPAIEVFLRRRLLNRGAEGQPMRDPDASR